MAAIAGERQVIIETTIGDAPVRVLAQPSRRRPAGSWRSSWRSRTAELDTLRTLLLVLLGGGLAVLAASVAVGYVYAGRALVPIRESLERQREFAADASHELRTPLAITRAAIAELRRGRDDPATVDRAIDDLDAGAARMEHLVADLLLLARTDAEAVERHAGTGPRERRGRGDRVAGACRGRRASGCRSRSRRRRCAATRRGSASWPRSSSTTRSATHRRAAA